MHSDGPRRERALTGHVLVVDDEVSLGELMKDLLESWGLRVTLRTSSLDARATFVSDPLQFDLVLTDQVMPGMTGAVLTQRLLNIRPELPIIMYTACSDARLAQELGECGIRALLSKPVDFNELFAVVKAALAPAGG